MSWAAAAQGAMKMMSSQGGKGGGGGMGALMGGGGSSGPMDIAGKVQTKQERNKTIAELVPQEGKKTKLGGVF